MSLNLQIPRSFRWLPTARVGEAVDQGPQRVAWSTPDVRGVREVLQCSVECGRLIPEWAGAAWQ